LGYAEWRNFTAVINKARTACEVSGRDVLDHLCDVNETIQSRRISRPRWKKSSTRWR
jgi:hypothetical protein